MACCALISQCISRHYPCCRCLPRTLIIIILAWPLPLEFLQSNFGGSSHNRTAGNGWPDRQTGSRAGGRAESVGNLLLFSVKLSICFALGPPLYSLLVLMACAPRALSIAMAKGIFNFYAYLLCVGHVPRQQFASRRRRPCYSTCHNHTLRHAAALQII